MYFGPWLSIKTWAQVYRDNGLLRSKKGKKISKSSGDFEGNYK